jgi:hypothetical protein
VTDLPARSSSKDVSAFLAKAARVPALSQAKGRLIFAVDATMSRQPTWDRAAEMQADMFAVAEALGGLAVQLVYFRGRGEFRASNWTASSSVLGDQMRNISCRSGFTQVERVLRHAENESKQSKVDALVYIGDCFEEDHDFVAAAAGALGLRGVPAFVFHEGHEPNAAAMFREIARLTKGVYARFDQHAADRLRKLLTAAAVYATGGSAALSEYGQKAGGDILLLARTMRGKP